MVENLFEMELGMLSQDIINNFVSPDGTNRIEIDILVRQFSAQLFDFLTNSTELSPLPELNKIDQTFFQIPISGQSIQEIQDKLEKVYQLSMNAANPRYLGHMDSIPSIYSILGDYIASALNNNMLSLEMSPLLTQLENNLMIQFASLFGLPNSSGGVMLSGGTLANLQALVVARNNKLKIKDGNVYSLSQQPVVFTSEVAHVSVTKSCMLMGIGSSNVIKVKSNQNAQMCVDDLILKIDEQIKLGNAPFAIVATAGTTITGSIDPLNEVANIAKRFNLWFHVDAIYGGALIFSIEHKHLINGIELADSISFNPQKWLYVAKTCSMVLFRDFSGMVNNFRITAPYMKDQEDFINLGEITVQGSKYAEVLKLWLSLLGLGVRGYEQLILHCYVLRDIFVAKIASRKWLELAANPDTNVICFRVISLDADQCDRLNEELQIYLLRQCGFFVSLPKFRGQNWLRVVMINPFTSPEIIDELFTKIDCFLAQFKLKLGTEK